MGLSGFSPILGENAGIPPPGGGGSAFLGGWVGGWVADLGRPPMLFMG